MVERGSIIIVDNNEALLNMLEAGLSSEGYRCETTTGTDTALELIGERPFDILISDIVMPGLDGFELTERAKKLRPGMAVIIMTGFIDDFSYDKAMEAGASDFIKKPFTLNEMKMRIQHVMLREKLNETSISDELTGLFNLKGFGTLAEREVKMALRYRKGIFLVYAALSNLGAIRDAFGRPEGNQALIETARILKMAFREADIIARIGEDEFAVLPAGFDGDDVGMITARLRENLEERNAKKNRRYDLSVEFGTAYYDAGKPSSVSELLNRAAKGIRRRET